MLLHGGVQFILSGKPVVEVTCSTINIFSIYVNGMQKMLLHGEVQYILSGKLVVEVTCSPTNIFIEICHWYAKDVIVLLSAIYL